MTTVTRVEFAAEDLIPLAGMLHCNNSKTPPDAVVLINSGAGIPATYYGRFASWLADSGIPVLTYDYRGIGHSRPASLRGFKASVEDWGSKDCAAALATLAARYPGVPVVLVGHSAGCFAAGFLRNPGAVAALVFIAPHTGYYGDYASRQRPFMWLAWHVLMPAVTRLVGYFPGRRFGLPEDLPRGVALEWAQRRRPDFRWNLLRADGSPDVERHAALQQRFAAFTGRALSIRIADDAFATAAGEDRIAGLFSGVSFERTEVEPQALGGGAIGHFGFFRSVRRHSLWPLVLDWLRRSAVPHLKRDVAPPTDAR